MGRGRYSFIWLLASQPWSAAPSSHKACAASPSGALYYGHYARSEGVCEWLGIPYATPPVHELRFAPPVRPRLKGDFNADNYGFDCPQATSNPPAYPNTTSQYARVYASFTGALNHTQSEDCLTLNVWSSIRSESALKPVFVFIHGGRFASGTSNTPFYYGGILSEAQDVVVVTMNFRQNIFGFPGSKETTQNLGFFDQRLAVEWVHEHIAAFGGDPNRITLVGQSSGAWAVSNWAYVFQDKPLVAGLISHSGSIFAFPLTDATVAAANWDMVASKLGCQDAESPLSCMRSDDISLEAILSAASAVPAPPISTPARSVAPFQATIDDTTGLSVSEYVSRLKAGNFAPIPHLQIHTDHESGYYRVSSFARLGVALPQSEWDKFELQTFTCATAAETYHKFKAGVPVYRARYFSDWDNLRLYEPPSSGPYHGVDINMVIGNSEVVSGVAPSQAEQKLTELVQGAWAAFAANPSRGAEGLGWPTYQPSEETLVRVGIHTTPEIDFVLPSIYDQACSESNFSYWDSSIPV
ncbi:putative carboxylesterase type b protein [Rosellinia necatrix]|uniref:Carboxylic ester hydrolase n=1 Tax=Rosellinia necatrix TaxID=77044 RepID=A0A1W2TC44_ROSNE|nr:putative carboxylesterase type b protein [Rosellinia necatrix]